MRAILAPLAVLLLAAGCTAGTPPPTSGPPASGSPTTSGSAPAGPGGTLPTAAPAEADAGLLAAIVLFPEDLPGAFASLALDPGGTGFRPAGASLSSALEPADEAEDVVRFGLLGDFTITYGSIDARWISVEAVAFASPEGAAGYLADWQEDLARAAAGGVEGSDLLSFSPAPDPTAAEEAVRAAYHLAGDSPDVPGVDGVVRVARAGATLAWVWAVGDDPAGAVDALAPLVEMHLLGVQAGELPARPPDTLGLAPYPTEVLSAFAFSYSYGIQSGIPAATFRVEVTGEFQAPDRASCLVTYTRGTEQTEVSRLVAIGTRVWLEGPATREEIPLRHPAALTQLPLCPGHPLFWEDTSFHRLPRTAGTPETLEGREVLRSNLAGDAAALAAAGYPAGRAGRVSRYEVVREAEGGWPLQVEVEEEATLAEARALFGLASPAGWEETPATIFTRLRLSRLDDPAIRVESPLTAG